MRQQYDLDTFKKIYNFKQQSSEFCKPYHDRAKQWYKNYRRYKEMKKQFWRYYIFDSLTFTLVETSAARMAQAIFSTSPIISVMPMKAKVKETKELMLLAKQLERAMDMIISNPDNEMFIELIDWYKTNCMYGASFLGIHQTSLFGKTTFEFEALEFFDCFPDPWARRVSKSQRFLRRYWQNFDYCKNLEQQGVFKNVDEIKSGYNSLEDEHKTLLEQLGIAGNTMTYDESKDRVELWDYYEDGHIITVGQQKTILRDTTKDKEKALPVPIPIIDLRFFTVPREMFGIGIPESIADDQEDLNVLRSQRRDNVELCLNKIVKASSLADVEWDTIKAMPGAVWVADDINALQTEDFGDVTQSSYTEAEQIKRSAMDAAGEYEYGRGVTPPRRETATGIIKLQQASMLRFDFLSKVMEFTGIRKMGKTLALYMRHFMSQSEYENLIEEPDAGFYNYSEEEIKSMYDFRPVGSAITAIKELKLPQMLQAIQMLTALPPELGQGNIEPFTVNFYQLIRSFLEDGLDIKNVDDYIIKAPEQQQQQGQPGMPGAGGEMNLDALMAAIGGGGQGGVETGSPKGNY